AVQLGKVACGGLCGPLEIETFVDPPIDSEPIRARSLGHELPEPSSTRRRANCGVANPPAEGDPHQRRGKTPLLQGPSNRGTVASTLSDPRLHQISTADVTAIVVEIAYDTRVPPYGQPRQGERPQPSEIAHRVRKKWIDQRRRRGNARGAERGPR